MDNLLSKSLYGVVYLMGLNFLTHGLTFVLNTLIVRMVQTNVFGFASVPLQLLVSTILFLSREAFRNACQRSAEGDVGDKRWQREWERKLTNLSWAVVPLGVAVTLATFALSVLTASPEERALDNYHLVVFLTGTAAFIELLSEPLYIFTLRFLLYRPRVVVEGTAAFLRCVATFLLVYFYPHLGALAFSFSWLVYSLTITLGYYSYFFYCIATNKPQLPAEPSRRESEPAVRTADATSRRDDGDDDGKDEKETRLVFPLRSISELFPQSGPTGWVDWDRVVLLRQFYWQSIQMYILTEGQKYLLKWTQTLEHIAIFSLVNNLGSLVVRFVFMPVEQVCNSLFSKYSELGPKKTAAVLTLLLKCLLLIGLCFVAFGPNYSFLLLDLMYTSKFSATDAPFILGLYCFYVALMAINGTTEAFTRAVSTPSDIKVYNYLLIGFSCTYVVAAMNLIPYFDTAGLILADCLSMSLRIAYCSYFIREFFREHSKTLKGKERENECGEYTFFRFRQCCPSNKVLVALVVSFMVTRLSEMILFSDKPHYTLLHAAAHVGIGGACLLAVLLTLFLTERRFLQDMRSVWRTRKPKAL